MATLIRPKADVEGLKQGPSQHWPAGNYVGEIEESGIKPLPEWAGEGEQAFFKLGNNVASDDTDVGDFNIGNRKQFINICISQNGQGLDTDEMEIREAGNWDLVRGLDTLMRVAFALGETSETDDGNVAIDTDAVVAAIAANGYVGRKLGYNLFVTDRKSYRKDALGNRALGEDGKPILEVVGKQNGFGGFFAVE